jgi:hypothetical protein
MREFWRVDTIEGEFFLVRSPVFSISSIVREYHLELLKQVREIQEFYLPVFDEPLFNRLGNYYQHIAKLLDFDAANLTGRSRHEFFVASEQRGEYWISGLEILMGYGFSEGKQEEPLITSKNYEIDLLAEIILCIPSQLIQPLIESKSSQYLSKLINQISRRSSGQEAIDKAQNERDLTLVNSLDKEIKEAGFYHG